MAGKGKSTDKKCISCWLFVKGNFTVIEISKVDCSDVAQLCKCTKNHCIIGLQWKSVMEIIP